MKKEEYRELLPLVNDHEHMLKLQSYANSRIQTLQVYLETTTDPIKVYQLQGSIAELRRIATLRDEVLSNSK
jgi:hypothetical protein